MAKAAPKLGPEINIDLLPSQGPAGVVGKTVVWMLSIGRYLIIFTEIVAIIIFITTIFLSTEKNALREQIADLSNQVSQQSSFERSFRQTSEKITHAKNLSQNQLLTHKVLDGFLTLLPEGVSLENLVYKDDQISFEGSFSSPSQLQTLVSSFSKSDTLVDLNLTKLNAPNETTPTFTFAGELKVIPNGFVRGKE